MFDGHGAIPESVHDAWQRAVEAWSDPARHDALIAQVTHHGCFAWAAARYRERAGDKVADEQLERLRRTATTAMFATGAARAKPAAMPYRNVLYMLVALVLLLLFALVSVAMISNSGSHSAPITKPAGP
jgi:hypothetical protein